MSLCVNTGCKGKAIPSSDICRSCTNQLSLISRMMRKTKTLQNGCIEYFGTKTKNGQLRQISYRGRMWPAARFSYFIHKGNIPIGMVVCHACDYPPCVNINHLFIGSNKDNSRDASQKFRLSHGEKHWARKLSDCEVSEMRTAYSSGMWSFAALSRKYGVSESAASRAIRKITWRHI